MMASFLMLFSPKTAGLVCFPAPCHLAGVRVCHLLLLRQGRFSAHLPFHCSEHLLFVQARTSLSFNVIAHASRKKPPREVQFYLESRSSHLGKLWWVLQRKKTKTSIREGNITHKATVHVTVDLQQPSGAGVQLCPTEATGWEQHRMLANLPRTGRNLSQLGTDQTR